jgi:hypothetical protein
VTHPRAAARAATRPSRPRSLPRSACASCSTAGQHYSGAPFQTWHEHDRAFLAVRHDSVYRICDDRSWSYGDWSDLADFRQRYTNNDPAVFIGNGIVTSIRERVLDCPPYTVRVQQEATRSSEFGSLSVSRQLAVLSYIRANAFDWEREGVSVESAVERGLRDGLETLLR